MYQVESGLIFAAGYLLHINALPDDPPADTTARISSLGLSLSEEHVIDSSSYFVLRRR
jgi:hypothetical protein